MNPSDDTVQDDLAGALAVVEWPDLSQLEPNLRLKARAARWPAAHGYTDDPAALTERSALLEQAGERLWPP